MGRRRLDPYAEVLVLGAGAVAATWVSQAWIVGAISLAMTIGARQQSGATEFNQQWIGHIDEVAIYNTALSAAQALAHFNAAQRPPIITLHPANTTYTSSTSSAHDHMVTLTANQLSTLASGGSVTVTSTVSTVTGTHQHDFTFQGTK